jgi:hypothetical protein
MRALLGVLPWFRSEPAPTVELHIVGRAETKRALNEMALRELHMTGDEFVSKLRAGALPNSPAVDHLAILADVADAR